jgi:hypothetical protein
VFRKMSKLRIGSIMKFDSTKSRKEAYNCGRKQGAVSVLDRVIDLVRTMPNADNRLPVINGMKLGVLDGGSVHRFTLIKELEKLKEEGV